MTIAATIILVLLALPLLYVLVTPTLETYRRSHAVPYRACRIRGDERAFAQGWARLVENNPNLAPFAPTLDLETTPA